MTDPPDRPEAAPPPQDAALARWLQDWQTIWISELQALAADRELIDAWDAGSLQILQWGFTAQGWAVGACAAAFGTAASGMAAAHEPAASPAAAVPRADASARAAAADPAPAAGDADLRALERRIAELERRLLALAGGTDGAGA